MGARRKPKAGMVVVGGKGELGEETLGYRGFYRVWDLR